MRKQARILPLLGPALVLYLVAHVASGGSGLSGLALLVAGVAVLVSLAPFAAMNSRAGQGTRRVGILGLCTAVALLACIAPPLLSLGMALSHGLALSALGGVTLHLAISVPDRPRGLQHPAIRLTPWLAFVAAGMGVLGHLPVIEFESTHVLVPAWWAFVPAIYGAASVMGATALRLLRRTMGSSPDALAENSWAIMGLVGALLATSTVLLLSTLGLLTFDSPWTQALMAAAALALVAGHVALVDGERRVSAGRGARRLVSAVLTLAIAFLIGGALMTRLEESALWLGIACASTVGLGALVYRGLSRVSELMLAPHGGALLKALERIERELGSVATLDDLARAVLLPLRHASKSDTAEPLLFTLDPCRTIGVDGAGQPRQHKDHKQPARVPDSIVDWMIERPRKVIVSEELERLVVRRPPLRTLVDTLHSLDALCVIPLSYELEVEGAVVVPRGRRRASLSLEEIDALDRLADRLSGTMALLAAQGRAQRRVGASDSEKKDLEERIEHLEEDLLRLRADAQSLKTGRAAGRLSGPIIAYGRSMKALLSRVADVAPMESPVLFLSEGGCAVDRMAYQLHAKSGRRDEAFVIAECASVKREQLAGALFGEAGEPSSPGWLELARGGTLLLLDVPALPIGTQRDLAEALAARQARPLKGAGAYPINLRLVATSRTPLGPLVDAQAFDAELFRWLSTSTLEVPPLRERHEDLPSLILLGIDRACRVLGRDPVGIDKAALDALLGYGWPGNIGELSAVLERAVGNCAGVKVQLCDLPALEEAIEEGDKNEESADPFGGTYADAERALLLRALDRASGNKSEAARSLGLKRTTFLDKLRRFGIRETERPHPTTPEDRV